jgi:uncharacterized protein YegL
MIQEVVAIIDRSGSMMGKEEDTIGGINATIDELKKNKTETERINFSVKFFDHQEKVYINSMNLDEVNPLRVSDLKPRGQTALLDAMGNTLIYFINKKMKDPGCFETCIIYVATDGIENCSRKYCNKTIKNLIEEAKKYCIEVLYLAANQDAILEASKFGLNIEQAINYSETSEHVEAVYRSVASSAKRSRTGDSLAFTDAERQASQFS